MLDCSVTRKGSCPGEREDHLPPFPQWLGLWGTRAQQGLSDYSKTYMEIRNWLILRIRKWLYQSLGHTSRGLPQWTRFQFQARPCCVQRQCSTCSNFLFLIVINARSQQYNYFLLSGVLRGFTQCFACNHGSGKTFFGSRCPTETWKFPLCLFLGACA